MENRIKPVEIDNRLIGPGYPPFIIAEACINHEGDIRTAEQMVYMAHAMGADCIKFQIHVLENEMLRQAPQSDNFEEPLWDTLERTNLSEDELIRLKKLCGELGIFFLCTPFSKEGADILDDIGVDCFKTGSGEMTNIPLIEHIAAKGKPMIVSTGMTELFEIEETVKAIKSFGVPLILTHCTSVYPCPYELVNLGMIRELENRFKVPVGLSDHSKGIYTALGAVSAGACLIEKHFTLDKTQKGPDHRSSIEPYELGELAKGSQAIFKAMGKIKRIFPEEKQIAAWARESVVSETVINKGVRITEEMVWVKRPGPGEGVVPARDLKRIIGKMAARDIEKGVQIKWDDIK